jgi:hypothetical protein
MKNLIERDIRKIDNFFEIYIIINSNLTIIEKFFNINWFHYFFNNMFYVYLRNIQIDSIDFKNDFNDILK